MKHWMLALVAIVALPHFGEPTACPQKNRMNNRKVKEIVHAPSVSALKAEFEKSRFPFQLQSLKCSGKDLLWFTMDEGSGGYLIHAFLYELHGESPRLVLHILPDGNRIAIEPRAEKQRIVILERRNQAPKDTGVIAHYYPED